MTSTRRRAPRRKPLAALRTRVNYRKARFKPFDLQGKVQTDLTWHNISYDPATGRGMMLVRFAPGAASLPHEHLDYEEFVMLEGDLVDCDGTRYRAGDCVSLAPGSRHASVSRRGCVVAAFLRGGLRTLSAHETLNP